ncbi:hypothetical protein GH733_002731, partial [Mirounga leonina]
MLEDVNCRFTSINIQKEAVGKSTAIHAELLESKDEIFIEYGEKDYDATLGLPGPNCVSLK